MMSIVWRGVMLLAGVGASIAMAKLAPLPLVWISALWGAILAVSAVATKTTTARAIQANLIAVVLAVGAAEGFLFLTEPRVPVERFAGSYTDSYFGPHQVLGYGPARPGRTTVEKYQDDSLIYQVAYTIGDNGLRISPDAGGDSRHSVIFFGCSLTFGEGVEDEQAMPYVVGLNVLPRYQVYNFGFHGYGPHQMLAALESGLVDRLVDEPPAYVIYQAISEHVLRVAGRVTWGQEAPRYELDADGIPHLAGRINESAAWWMEQLKLRAANKSLIFRKLFGKAYRDNSGREYPVRSEELQLYSGVVRAAQAYVSKNYPAAEFHVLLWDYPGDAAVEPIRKDFLEAGIKVHLISDILPGFSEDPVAYRLSSHDRHPNVRAHRLIAEYVSEKILAPGPSAAR